MLSFSRRAVMGLAALSASLAILPAQAGTIDTIRQAQTIRIAYREDAPPFSMKGTGADPAGYIVDLCRAVAANLAEQLGLPQLHITYVPVTAANRFDAIQQGSADLLCEATSETLERRKIVDFSIPTFVDGASLLIQTGGPTDLAALAGLKVGVLGGTTTEQSLRNTLKVASVDATVVLANSHEEGLQMLEAGTIAAYFGDRAILQYLLLSSKSPEKLMLANNYMSVELYALALPHGDEDFRLAVDTALSQIYRSGDIAKIFKASFGTEATPSSTVEMLYMVSGLQP